MTTPTPPISSTTNSTPPFHCSFLTSSEESMAILNNTDNTASAANTPLYWTIFHTISAYNNCGYSLQRDSFAR